MCLCLAALPATAQTKASATAPQPPSPQIIGDADTQLVVDTEHHAVRIMIDGREVARFEANGLHVEDDVFLRSVINSVPHHSKSAKEKPAAPILPSKGEKQ